jgi:hypothetical protein
MKLYMILGQNLLINMMSYPDRWNKRFRELEEYINEHSELPGTTTNKQLNSWMDNQKNRYRYKKDTMKKPEIYNLWSELINKYPELFCK